MDTRIQGQLKVKEFNFEQLINAHTPIENQSNLKYVHPFKKYLSTYKNFI